MFPTIDIFRPKAQKQAKNRSDRVIVWLFSSQNCRYCTRLKTLTESQHFRQCTRLKISTKAWCRLSGTLAKRSFDWVAVRSCSETATVIVQCWKSQPSRKAFVIPPQPPIKRSRGRKGHWGRSAQLTGGRASDKATALIKEQSSAFYKSRICFAPSLPGKAGKTSAPRRPPCVSFNRCAYQNVLYLSFGGYLVW